MFLSLFVISYIGCNMWGLLLCRSGMRLSYWVEQSGDLGSPEGNVTNFVANDEEIELAVDPLEKIVVLPGFDSHQQVEPQSLWISLHKVTVLPLQLTWDLMFC